jgi:hypothetical protein
MRKDAWASDSDGKKSKGRPGKAADPWEGWSNMGSFGAISTKTIAQQLAEGDASIAKLQEDISKEYAKIKDRDAMPERLRLANMELQEAGVEMQNEQRAQRESKLAAMFGPIDEFNIYTEAFSALSGAVGSALSAWIDGSQSAGAAFKAFIGEAVKGIAIQMAMESLKHGAFMIGSLAQYDYAGAAMHGKAAAGFAAGAIIAAGAAKSLGASGGGISGGSARTGSGSGFGGSARQGDGYGNGGKHTVIVQGDPHSDDTPRYRQRSFAKALRRATGTSGGVHS